MAGVRLPAAQHAGGGLSTPSDQAQRLRDRLTTHLVTEHAVVTRRLAALRGDFTGIVEASRDTNADDEHDPEGATIAFERSQLDTVLRQTERRLAEVEAALARLDDGTYGTCEGCGRPIPAERIEARPAARRCVGCGG